MQTVQSDRSCFRFCVATTVAGEFMSAICGFVGPGDPDVIQRMLDAAAYRGDNSAIASETGVGIGYRYWGGRPGKSDGVLNDATALAAVAGSFAPPVASPAAELARLIDDPAHLAALDGNFAAAHWDKGRRRLTWWRRSKA